MFNGKLSQLISDQERTRLNIPVDSKNTYAETIYASSSSGFFQRLTVFSIQPRSLRGPRGFQEQGQEQEHEQERRQEQEKEAGQKDSSRQIADTRHNYKSTHQPNGRQPWGQPGLVLACLVVALLVGCRGGNTDTWNDLYSSGRRLLELGDQASLAAAESKADQGLQQSAVNDPEWNWKFRVLKAEVLGWRGKAKDVIALLSVPPPPELSKGEFAVRAKLAEGWAEINVDHHDLAGRAFAQAEELASSNATFMLSQVALYKGVLALRDEKYRIAEGHLLKALDLARLDGNHFVESQALTNLAAVATKTGRFDEAIDYFLQCKSIAHAASYAYQEHIQLANLLWNYLELGDLPKAVSSYSQEEKVIDSFEPFLRKLVFEDLGAVYRAKEDYLVSKKYYLKAYDVADQMQRAGESNENGFMARIQDSLAEVALDEGNVEDAVQHSLQVAALHGQRPEFDLTSARVAIATRDFKNARILLEKTIQDAKADVFVRWQAQAELANFYVAQNDALRAELQFQKAIASFENTHIVLSSEENKMAFFQKSARVYDQYIGLLLAENKPLEALKVAESNRAHSLAEGLGLKNLMVSSAMNLPGVQGFLAKRNSVVLAYWLGNKRSIAWVIAPKGFQFFTLPARRDIARLVDQYNRELQHSGDDGRELGEKLYSLLVQPAEMLIPQETHVIRIADGALSQLNFEALVPPNPSPHYWIDDVEVENASSLPLYMRAAAVEPKHSKSLLLEKLLVFGNPAQAAKEFPPLLHAEKEIASLEKHFPEDNRTVIKGKDAVPSAYAKNHPDRYGVIHFATHGIASEISPLDSAIILAPEVDNNSARYKLYAHEIIKEPLKAELVTISACSGAGTRSYSGEGLVGLAWGFLRAGAHHVIAGLWDVDDAAAPELMDRFYTELGNDHSPAAALRSAKRAMLHSNTVRQDPYYWASLQLYTGS